jgi:hypothetical protein
MFIAVVKTYYSSDIITLQNYIMFMANELYVTYRSRQSGAISGNGNEIKDEAFINK